MRLALSASWFIYSFAMITKRRAEKKMFFRNNIGKKKARSIHTKWKREYNHINDRWIKSRLKKSTHQSGQRHDVCVCVSKETIFFFFLEIRFFYVNLYKIYWNQNYSKNRKKKNQFSWFIICIWPVINIHEPWWNMDTNAHHLSMRVHEQANVWARAMTRAMLCYSIFFLFFTCDWLI